MWPYIAVFVVGEIVGAFGLGIFAAGKLAEAEDRNAELELQIAQLYAAQDQKGKA
jgi:Tfp pilus assembly protein PilN